MNLILLIIIINIVFFGAIAYFFFNVRITMREDQKEQREEVKRHEEKIEKDEAKIKDEIREAHEKAQAILTQSESIAKELIGELETALNLNRTDVSVQLPSGSRFEIELGQLSEKLKGNYVRRIREMLTSLDNFRVDQAQKFEAFEEEQENITSQSLQQVRIEELEKVRVRIEQYKDAELALFDQKVIQVIDQAAKEVLGQALSSSEQEVLVERALEKAKREGVI